MPGEADAAQRSGPRPPARPPLTESPWFWVALFGVAGLAAIVAVSPRYGARHDRLDRMSDARRAAWQHRVGIAPDNASEPSLAEPHAWRRSLVPLTIALAGGIAVAAWLLSRCCTCGAGQSGHRQPDLTDREPVP